MLNIFLSEKHIYGWIAYYPNCDMSLKLCKCFNKKCFNKRIVKELKDMGFNIVISPQETKDFGEP